MKSADCKFTMYQIWRRVLENENRRTIFKWGVGVPFAEGVPPAHLLATTPGFRPSPSSQSNFEASLDTFLPSSISVRHAFSPAFILRHARPLDPGLFNHRSGPRAGTAPRRSSRPPLLHQQPPLHQQPDFLTSVRFLSNGRLLTFRRTIGTQAQRGCGRLDDEIEAPGPDVSAEQAGQSRHHAQPEELERLPEADAATVGRW